MSCFLNYNSILEYKTSLQKAQVALQALMDHARTPPEGKMTSAFSMLWKQNTML